MQCVVSSVPVSSNVNHLVRLESEWLSEIHSLNYYIIIKWLSKAGSVDFEVRVKLYIVQSGLEGSCGDETVLLEHIVKVIGVIYPNPVVLAVAEEGKRLIVLWHVDYRERVGDAIEFIVLAILEQVGKSNGLHFLEVGNPSGVDCCHAVIPAPYTPSSVRNCRSGISFCQ